jgi:hypothetical protein
MATFRVTPGEKDTGIIVVFVKKCSVDSMTTLHELSGWAGNIFTKSTKGDRLGVFKTRDRDTLDLLLCLSMLPGNDFVFPQVARMKSSLSPLGEILIGDAREIGARRPPISPTLVANHRQCKCTGKAVNRTPKPVRRDPRTQFPSVVGFARY